MLFVLSFQIEWLIIVWHAWSHAQIRRVVHTLYPLNTSIQLWSVSKVLPENVGPPIPSTCVHRGYPEPPTEKKMNKIIIQEMIKEILKITYFSTPRPLYVCSSCLLQYKLLCRTCILSNCSCIALSTNLYLYGENSGWQIVELQFGLTSFITWHSCILWKYKIL